jgi:hypothetical protein
MRFDKAQFAQLISDQAGLDKKTTDQLLGALLNEILSGIDKNGSYTLKGFGQFVQTSDGLKFKADEVLALELNFEFAGLEPIEVAPAVKFPSTTALFDKKEVLEEDDVEDEDIYDEEDIEAPAGLSLSDQDVADLAEDEESGGWEYEMDEEVAAKIPETEEESEPEVFDYAALPKMKPDARAKEANKEKAFSKFRSDQEKGRKVNYFGVIATIVLAILIALASWFVLKPYFDNKSLEENATVVAKAEDPQNTANEMVDSLNIGALPTAISGEEPITERSDRLEQLEESINSDLALGDIEQEVDESLSEPIAEKTAAEKPQTGIQFGLYGNGVANIENSTTIVVHSLGNKASADRVAKDLAAQDYKTVVFLTKMSDGQEFWRVGIGQFQNFEAAAKSREKLKEPFKSRSFVAKITF